MSQRIEYKKFPRGETCGEIGCRSRFYYVQDGRAYCKSHDHIWLDWRQVQQDEDDFGTQGRKTRVKRQEVEKVVALLSGAEARELFLHSWQLILWKQVSWLTRPKEEGGAGLPQELEGVVRGLWALRLRTLVVEEPVVEEGGFSSQSEIEDSGEDTSGTEMTGISRRGGKMKRLELRLMETLALCYLGTVLMRLPISVGEFFDWAEKEDIIYIRAIRYVPKEMKSKLPVPYLAALDTRSPIKPDSLHKTILSLITTLNESTGIEFPQINYRLLTFYHVKKLGLPLEIYLAIHRLSKLLNLTHNFPSNSTSRLPILLSPEVQIIALLTIATKLAYPFSSSEEPENSETRTPTSQNLKIDWDVWKSIMISPDRGIKKQGGGLVKGQEIRVTEEDVFRMNGKELDDYLGWYQRTFVEEDDEGQKMPSQLLRLFPLSPPTPNTPTSSQPHNPNPTPPKIKTIHQTALKLFPTSPSDEIKNTHYRTIADLPPNAKAFYEIAAKQVSCSLETLTRAVFSTERRLVEWMVAERRRDGDEGDEIGSGDE